MILLSAPQEYGDPVELHVVAQDETDRDLRRSQHFVLAVHLERSGLVLPGSGKAWFRNRMWTVKHDMVTRNAEVDRVADFFRFVADEAGVVLPRAGLMSVLSHDSMAAVSVLYDVMES